MYTFIDRNDESVSLRPEATASVVRAYIQHRMFAEKATDEQTRLYYIGPMFRRERPQAGRFRQFYQVGAEVLGSSDDPMIEAEVIEMLNWMLVELGITDTALLINSVGDKRRAPYIETSGSTLRVFHALCNCHRRYEINPLRVDCKVRVSSTIETYQRSRTRSTPNHATPKVQGHSTRVAFPTP
jgi:histidyl-tRNA synthetase